MKESHRMSSSRTIIVAITVVAACMLSGLAVASASAAGPQPPNCSLVAAGPATDHALTLPGGEDVVVRDPYGGLLPRTSLFFDFTVRAAGGGKPSGVASVTWSLDGELKRTDATAPFEWKGVSGSNSRMPAGDHEVSVAVTPAGGGAPVLTSFALTATDCPPASTFNEIGLSPGIAGSRLYAASAGNSTSGPTFNAVTFGGQGVTARIPAAARGLRAGQLVYSSGNAIDARGAAKGGARHTLALRVPRAGTTLDSHGAIRVVLHPGAKSFLTVTGLPAGTREVQVRLQGAGGARLLSARRVSPKQCRYSTTARLSGPDGAITLNGGGVSGVC